MSKITCNILIIFTMKLLLKVTEYEFGILVPEKFSTTDNGTGCSLITDEVPDLTAETKSPITWLYSSRALVSVFGGLLANAFLGYTVTLKCGGVVLMFTTLLLNLAVHTNQICDSGSALVLVTWLIVPIQYGMIQPSILYGFYKGHLKEPRKWAILTGAYYCALAVGAFVALLLSQQRKLSGNVGNTLVCIWCSSGFFLLSFLLGKDDESPRQFLMPTPTRVVFYSKIFSFLALSSVSIADTQATVFSVEMRFFINATGGEVLPKHAPTEFLTPVLIKLASQFGCSLLLMLAAYLQSSQLSMVSRIYGGILIEAFVTVSLLFVVSVATPRSPEVVRIVYAIASVLDGAAEILAVSAGYEIMVGVAQSTSRILVFGICCTIWGLANLIGRGMVAVLSDLPTGNPVLRPSSDRQTLFFVYHLVILSILTMSFLNFMFSGRSIVTMLFMTEVVDLDSDHASESLNSTNGSQETSPLLDFS